MVRLHRVRHIAGGELRHVAIDTRTSGGWLLALRHRQRAILLLVAGDTASVEMRPPLLLAGNRVRVVARHAAQFTLARSITNTTQHLLDVADGRRAAISGDSGSHHEQSPTLTKLIARSKMMVMPPDPQLMSRTL